MDWVRILEDLIRIDTSVPPGNNYEKVIDYLEPLFRQAGLQTQKILIPREHAGGLEGRINLLAHRGNPGKPRLIFYTHVDVVPAEGWDAFNPKIEDGKLYGRGAADMKGAIPALLLALEKTKRLPIQYDVSVVNTTDEEYDQGPQLNFLASFIDGLEDSLIFDLDSSFGGVTIGALGAIHFDILVRGKSVHSGLAHLGENAVEKSIKILNDLLKLKSRVETKFSRVATDPDFGIPYLQAKLNINVIKGGLKVNIVPDECLISVDRRAIPEENLDEVEKEILTALERSKIKYEIKNLRKFEGFITEDPIADHLNNLIKKVTGKSGKYGIPGSGEICEWVRKHRVRLFGIGVIRPDCNIHGKDEFVYLKDVENLAEIIAQFLSLEL